MGPWAWRQLRLGSRSWAGRCSRSGSVRPPSIPTRAPRRFARKGRFGSVEIPFTWETGFCFAAGRFCFEPCGRWCLHLLFGPFFVMASFATKSGTWRRGLATNIGLMNAGCAVGYDCVPHATGMIRQAFIASPMGLHTPAENVPADACRRFHQCAPAAVPK